MSLLRCIVIATLACFWGMLLPGCVTTTDNVFSDEASPEDAMQRRVELARQYIGEGDWENAKRNLKLAVEIDADSAEIHEAFALVYQSTGEYELAEQSFRNALQLDPEFSRLRNNYAAFLFMQQRYQEAETHLERVVSDPLYSARPMAYTNLGLCRLQLSDASGAEAAFTRVLTMDRTNQIALLELAHLRFEAGDYAASAGHYGIYRTAVRPQSARSLWLGIRLSKALGDVNAEGSYILALRNLYPQSAEYKAYQRARQSD
ncbi:MAG: type IV pilus biogenesis/stability protein PilW [Halieaceae bacterium]|nr:type IV pilus biogenesis/stability protein PilW [Halieaceae bacterium]